MAGEDRDADREDRDARDLAEPPVEVGTIRGMFANLPRRIRLTLEYEGLSGFLSKSFRFLIRLTPFRSLLRGDAVTRELQAKARAWYRRNSRFVTVVIPAYGDPEPTLRAVKSVRRTTKAGKVRVLVVDDASPSEQRALLEKRLGGSLVAGAENVGFSRNVNRALGPLAENPNGDVVLLNNDVIAHRGWLESLQFAAYRMDEIGVVGAKLLYPDGTIQFGGSIRNLGAPEWFDHRFRFKPGDHGPANVPGPALAVTGACMYIKEEALRAVGALDENFGMAFEDVDYCLRAWEAGFRVHYHPPAVLTHAESKSRGRIQGERELQSRNHFWSKWGAWFDERPVRTEDGRLRIAYVTQDTGVGGGHRVIFEQLHRLAERGHDVSLYTLGGAPDWYDLRVPVESFPKYEQLIRALSDLEAIKVATWWETAEPVWLASVRRGIPAYLVQDIETSYYPEPEQRQAQNAVLASYRSEFRYLTTSPWNVERLAELGHSSTIVSCGVDRDTFRPIGSDRHADVLLAVGRSHHLKNLDLTIEAWRALPEPRPELWLYGVEPELGERYGARYFDRPTDAEINELLNRATVFVQTSRHEGFCLPLLEAMSAGTPTVCTDAHGNRGFCREGLNTLIAESSAPSVSAALETLLTDHELRQRLTAEGLRTAEELDWRDRGDPLEAFFQSVAEGDILRKTAERDEAA
jgi:GT2 family glycosyltransferase/glycosyltransferase involved in cell wall biosynthesis